jgi:hypothetical protein
MPTYRISSIDQHADGRLIVEVAFWLGTTAQSDPFLRHQFIFDFPRGKRIWAQRDAQGRCLRVDGTAIDRDALVEEDHERVSIAMNNGQLVRTPVAGRLLIEDSPRTLGGWEIRDRIREQIRGFIRQVLKPIAQRWQAGERGAAIRQEIRNLGLAPLPYGATNPEQQRPEVIALVGTGEVTDANA